MPKPDRGRVTKTYALAPETAQTIRRLAAEQDTFPGDIIDRAVKETQMDTLLVVREGSPNDDPEIYAGKPYVWVGKCRSQSDAGGPGMGPQSYGVWVFARQPDGYHPFSTLVCGPTVWEPETLNKLGLKGAYRDLPPTPEQIEAAIGKAVMALDKP